MKEQPSLTGGFTVNKLARYIIIAVATAAVMAIVWYFQGIVTYVLVAAVLSLVGKPLMDVLAKVQYKKFYIPRALCAAITLAALWVVFVLFFYTFIPLIFEQLNEFSKVDVMSLTNMLDEPLHKVDNFVRTYFSSDPKFSIKDTILQEVKRVVSFSQVSDLFGSLAGIIKGLGIALFAITFITFFFLKEEKLFFQSVVLIFPQQYEAHIKHALTSVNRLLVRYFIGLFTDILCVMILLTLGLGLATSLSWQQAMLIGLIAGVLNMVPYVGPLVGVAFGLLISLVSAVNGGVNFMPLAIKLLAVFATVQIIDMSLLQPTIYSNSVKAHPLEIFLVILIAGSIAGILGMLIAIPTYTVARVFAKEFFNNLRVVQKLTEKI